MARLASEQVKLMRVPVIRQASRNGLARRLFERPQDEAVRRGLRGRKPDLQAAVTIAYTYGWRMRSEALRLDRRHLKVVAGTLGQRRCAFRKVCAKACEKAGCSRTLWHDFRRTSVRNMVNDGTPEKVAMMITRRKARAVFDRCHFVAPAGLKAATVRRAQRIGHNYGHSEAASLDGRSTSSENS